MRAQETRPGGRHLAEERGYKLDLETVQRKAVDRYQEHGRAPIAECLPGNTLLKLALFRESLPSKILSSC